MPRFSMRYDVSNIYYIDMEDFTMAKASKVAEYMKHSNIIRKRKTPEQIKEEQNVSLMATAQLLNQLDTAKWQEKEREIARADARHKAEVEQSFEVLRGRLSVDACLEECATLLQGIKAVSKGEECAVVPVVRLEWLESENVTAEDAEKAAKFEQEAFALVADIKARIARNGESIRDTLARIGGDEALAKKLRKLEAQRKKALLAGDDLTELNAEIMGLRDEIEKNKMAVGIAEQDSETLKAHGEALQNALAEAEELAAHISARAASLFIHSKVDELNQVTGRLVQLAQDVAEAKKKTRRSKAFVQEVLCSVPSCGVGELILPMWQGRTIVPDFEGGTKDSGVRLVVRIGF